MCFMKTQSLFSLLFLSLFISPLHAAVFQAESAEHPIAVIELYTSQGCSSCPPAEKWLGQLESTNLAKSVVPLALHVDYWDYIGWKDQFAQKYFSVRQARYKHLGKASSIYTPQIMFNGEDVRRVRFNKGVQQLKSKQASVAFTVKAEKQSANKLAVDINFSRIDDIAKDSNVILILTENNLSKDIDSGENAGRTLEHQHVVRVWNNLGKVKQSMQASIDLNPNTQLKNHELVVVIETTDMQTQQALQLALH